MKKRSLFLLSIVCLVCLVQPKAIAQSKKDSLAFLTKLDSIPVLHLTDTIQKNVNGIQKKIDQLQAKPNMVTDSLQAKLLMFKQNWQAKQDSLKKIGALEQATNYKNKLDSLEKYPEQQYQKLVAKQSKLTNGIQQKSTELKAPITNAQNKIKGISKNPF